MPHILYYGLRIEYSVNTLVPGLPGPRFISAKLVDLEEWVKHPKAIAPLDHPLAWAREHATKACVKDMNKPNT